MQKIRRTVQILVFLFIIIVPLVNYYGIKLEQKDYNEIKRSTTLSFIHKFFKGKDRIKAVESTHKIKGSVWTAEIFGLKISDPLAVFESTIVPLYIYIPLLLSALIPLLFTLILGRIYCGWLCPINFLLEMNDKLRNLLIKLGYNSRDISFDRRTKYFVLIIGVIIALLIGMPLHSLIYPPAVLSREIFYKIYYGFWGNGLLIIAFICFFELILSRRWWCRYICPGGAIYITLSRFKMLNITRDDKLCNNCGDCNPVCPHDLKPMDKELKEECDQCRQCISSCEVNALKHNFNLRIINRPESVRRV